MNKARILLLSGYDAASHRFWRNQITSGLSQYDWTEIVLADRFFSWRARGNALTFAFEHQEILQKNYDCIVATSMVDLTNLRGFVPHLASIPALVYFHENQFDYPNHSSNKMDQNIINLQLTSIYNLLSADKILFNSNYNRTTFFRGANRLLNKLPDGIPKGLLDEVEKKTQVFAVPIDDCFGKSQSSKNKTIQIVWNHRWEYDKQPEVLFKALELLKADGIDFKFHLLGQSFRKVPDCFSKAKELFCDEIETWGFQPREKYLQILDESDIVVSTALHDFQGLSMLEAIARGCLPVAPNRVAYPEYISQEFLYSIEDSTGEAQSLYQKLVELIDEFNNNERGLKTCYQANSKIASIEEYFQSNLIPKYQSEIDQLIKITTDK